MTMPVAWEYAAPRERCLAGGETVSSD
jgi:hypothetical protein